MPDHASSQPIFSTYTDRRINGSIADWLGGQIVAGLIPEGMQVPIEMDFVRDAGVSRGAYREALRVVSSKGMLITRTRHGTRVAPRDEWSLLDADVVRWFFEMGSPPDWFIRALYELRAMIEPEAAAYAALRRSEENIADFRKSLDAMRQCDITQNAWHAADAGFHRTLLRSSGNPVVASLEMGICAAVAFTTAWRYRDMPEPHTRNPVDEHEAVFERILARDAKGARALMVELVDTALLDTSGQTAHELKRTRSWPGPE